MNQAARHDAVVSQGAQEPGDLLVLLTQPPVGEQPCVGVGGVRQPLHESGQQQGLDPAAPVVLPRQRPQMAEGVARGTESQRAELTLHRLGAQ